MISLSCNIFSFIACGESERVLRELRFIFTDYIYLENKFTSRVRQMCVCTAVLYKSLSARLYIKCVINLSTRRIARVRISRARTSVLVCDYNDVYTGSLGLMSSYIVNCTEGDKFI